MEKEEGRKNEGVRIEIYLERKEKQIKNEYEIIGEKELMKMVKKKFGWK